MKKYNFREGDKNYWLSESGSGETKMDLFCSECGAKNEDICVDLYDANIIAVCQKCGNHQQLGEE
jgi:hypothetical protein